MAFRAALRWAHIDLQDDAADTAAVASAVPQAEPQEKTVLAEHVSPPFREEVRLTLKVSQNLHAATTPYLLGAILAHRSTDAFQQGLALERKFLMQAGLDPESVSQLDGEGGMGSAFSPDFMVRYLAYMNRQPYGRTFFNALPVLGRDGTLSEMLTNSPAAGHVHAKTGSYVVSNALDDGVIVLGKGLVGYVDARNGHRLAFAAYANFVPLHDMNDVAELAEMLCRLAEAIYLDAPPASASSPRPPAR
jgi:PBP4 family serine-type D-alanyl-D-alanine carboxypeptidase